ncbi:AMP-binding protein [Sphingopyxis sp. OPL5]|uniref:AMP-binding protein n=1 Tax=Sphingopyxis sp. OPL5 TaxID=2486273 RepID=UPI00164DEB68|nr:AMP-binding protein [Sphingopyxis sp. OPL5]QNO27010.1 AMP-binding protein [Sphingopyxis sp. OPL5]
MSSNFIEAMTAAAARAPGASLTVASDRLPCITTLSDVVAAGRRMGTRMTAAGVGRGDIIACMLANWREWLVVAVASGQAGAVMLPIVTIYGAKELGFILRQSGAKWLFTPDRFRNVDYAQVVADCGDLPALERHIAIGRAFAALEADGPIADPVPVDANDLALLVYTSGTTADPKGVMHSARGFLAELETMRAMRAGGDDDAVISPWPPGHVAGALSMYRFLCQGTPLILMDQWDAALAAELIDRHKVTSSSGTPFHLSGMIAAADIHGYDLTSLRQYLVGAAPVPPSLIERCQRQGLAVYHCYGSSEHPTVTSGVVDDPLDKQLHTEGRAIAGSEMRFIDDDGHDVAPGEDGEICTRGPELFLGYLDPALNETAFLPGGWYRTGDIGRLDEGGYLLITDRKKDIIIRGGENISSKEVEAVLLAHPAVADVAVVAAPDDRMGEVVRACVVLAPGGSLTLDEVRDHFFSSGIAKQKTPERLSIVDELPRNASGKVLKHQLRETA